MNRSSRQIELIVALLITSLLAGCGSTRSDSLIDVPVVDREGRATTIGASIGDEPLVISLWAVWCQPCKRELPELERVANDPESGVDVLAVNIGDDPERVDEFVSELGIELPVALDLDGEVLEAIGAPSVPVTVIVDVSGRTVWKKIGALEAGEVESVISEL